MWPISLIITSPRCSHAAGKPLWNFEEPLYTLLVENVRMPGMAKPQTVNLLELLEDVFRDCPLDSKEDEPKTEKPVASPAEPDTSRLKYLLLALIENGQRHDYHGHGPPSYGVHACARKGKNIRRKRIRLLPIFISARDALHRR